MNFRSLNLQPSLIPYQFQITILFILLFYILISPIAQASSYSSRTSFELRMIRDSAIFYHQYHGHYPVTDEHSTWLEKLTEENFMSDDVFFEGVSQNHEPLDLDRHPYIYKVPGLTVPNLKNPAYWPIVRTVGQNGIDEKGAGDDWDLRFGPNWGYWYKKDWSKGLKVCAICILMLILLLRFSKSWNFWFRAGSLSILLGIAIAVCAQAADSHFMTPSCYLPYHKLIEKVIPILWFLVGIPALMISAVTTIIHRINTPNRIFHNHCLNCNYNLNYNTTGRCPECGHLIEPDNYPIQNQSALTSHNIAGNPASFPPPPPPA